jgi:hypothetical protein
MCSEWNLWYVSHPRCNVRRDRDKIRLQPLEESALHYWPISTTLALLLSHGQGLHCVTFQPTRCNARRNRDEKLFRPQEQSTFRYRLTATKLGLLVANWQRLKHVMFHWNRCKARTEKVRKLFWTEKCASLLTDFEKTCSSFYEW